MLAWRDWKKMVVAKNAMSAMVAGQTLGPGQAASSPSAQQGGYGSDTRYQFITRYQTHQVKVSLDHQLLWRWNDTRRIQGMAESGCGRTSVHA